MPTQKEVEPERLFKHQTFPGWALDKYTPVAKAAANHGLSGSEAATFIERDGERFLFPLRWITFYHAAWGSIRGFPFLVTYCGLCHSGMAFHPFVNGERRHFRPGGMYDGMLAMRDLETGSYWNHFTGECIIGPSKGQSLDFFDLGYTTIDAAKARPNTYIFEPPSNPIPFFWRVLEFVLWVFGMSLQNVHGNGFWFGFNFGHLKSSRGTPDKRMPLSTSGLGVVVKTGKTEGMVEEQVAKFYPMDELKKATGPVSDEIGGVKVKLYIKDDGFPEAEFVGNSAEGKPFQNFMRWYGFSETFKRCELYSHE